MHQDPQDFTVDQLTSLRQGLAHLFYKELDSKYVSFADIVVSVTTTQLYSVS